jgi:MFS family permease
VRASSADAKPAPIAAYWFGIQFVWGAILAVSLQSRVSQLVPFAGVEAYARLAAIGAFVGMVTQLGVGPLSDRMRAEGRDRRAFYAAGLVVAVPSLWFFYAAPTFAQLGLAFYGLQIGMNVAIGPYQAVIPDYVAPGASGRASAWMAALQSLGNASGLALAGFVADVRIVALALAAVLSGSYAITIVHVARIRPRPVTTGEVRVDAAFRTLLASRGFINLGFYTLLGFLFFFVRESLGIVDARLPTAVCFLAFTLCGIAGAALGGRPSDRYDKRAVVSVANGVVALCLAVLAAAPRLEIAYVASSLAGCAWGAFFTADWALACNILPQAAMASAMGIWNVATAVPQVIAPLVTAPLIGALNARSPGLGPRGAVVLAIVEFTIGALWLWRRSAADAAGAGAAVGRGAATSPR